MTKCLRKTNLMKSLLLISALIFFNLFTISCQEEKKEPWVKLVQNNTFNGWEMKNGTANYEIDGQTVIGTTKMNTPNTFLCTKEHYDDFILEFEVWADSTINSGVQFRSNSFKDYNKGRVHGYQAEIDPSDRAWSGGIYEEGKRGWLYNLEKNQKGRDAFKNGEWNHYRIEAIGNRLAIWVNGINTANLEDDETPSGFIGLQIHSIGNAKYAGKKVKWKNIKIITDNPQNYITITSAPLIKS